MNQEYNVPSEHILHLSSCEDKPEPQEVTSSAYMSKEQHQQLELSQQSSDQGVNNTIGLPHTLTSTSVPLAPPTHCKNQVVIVAKYLVTTVA